MVVEINTVSPFKPGFKLTSSQRQSKLLDTWPLSSSIQADLNLLTNVTPIMRLTYFCSFATSSFSFSCTALFRSMISWEFWSTNTSIHVLPCSDQWSPGSSEAQTLLYMYRLVQINDLLGVLKHKHLYTCTALFRSMISWEFWSTNTSIHVPPCSDQWSPGSSEAQTLIYMYCLVHINDLLGVLKHKHFYTCTALFRSMISWEFWSTNTSIRVPPCSDQWSRGSSEAQTLLYMYRLVQINDLVGVLKHKHFYTCTALFRSMISWEFWSTNTSIHVPPCSDQWSRGSSEAQTLLYMYQPHSTQG